MDVFVTEQNIDLTPVDRLILESYQSLMEGLADYLGEGCELVLHSLEDLEHSVIKIINGHHTGRREGFPITDLALNMLSRLEGDQGGEYSSYLTRNKAGEPLKAATILVRGEKGRVIALLCINFYLNTPLSKILAVWTLPGEEQGGTINENFADSPLDLVGKSVNDAVQQVDNMPDVTPSNRNKRIVCLLADWGIFKMKSSVDLVAKKLGISKNTVYLHLRNCSEKN